MTSDPPDDHPEFLTYRTPFQWVEFLWLCVVDARFRATRHKRKAYFEHRMLKRYERWRY